jgi:hypothetical protein
VNHHTTNPEKKKCPAFYVPVDLDLSDFPAAVRDCVACFLNLIHWKWVNWQANDDGFVPLKRRYIERIIPRSVFIDIRGRLIGMGVVQCDGHYRPGSKCLGYQLAPAYRITRRIVCTDTALRRRIAKLQQRTERKLSRGDRWLQSNLLDLSFDATAARQTIQGMTPRYGSAMKNGEYRVLIGESVSRLAGGERDYHPDDYGRVHTPVTRLPRELRGCLSVEGEPLVGVDLANSQPLILGMVIAKKRSLKKAEGRQAGGATLISSAESTESVNGKRVAGSRFGDVQEYLNLCESGRLYESLMSPGDDRTELKRAVFRDVFFGRPGIRSDLASRFSERFPTVISELRRMKRGNYKAASHRMQRLESDIFIDSICGRIMRERPATPTTTIHDSILTTPAHIGYVRSVITDEFERMGVRPTLHEERY